MARRGDELGPTGLDRGDGGHKEEVTLLLVVAALLVAWCVLPLPLAMACGKAFREGEKQDVGDQRVRRYDAAGV